MQKLTTFEDIFNLLTQDYHGLTVEVSTKQKGVSIANFTTTINKIIIKPLNKKQSSRWTKDNKKVGLIEIQDKINKNTFSIPFILGFNTMKAVFLNKGVVIKSLDMEFSLKKDRRKKLA